MITQEDIFDMKEEASYFINKPLHLRKEIINIEIPNHVEIGQIIGKNGKHIKDVRNRFNAQISVKSDISPSYMRIILNREDYITSIKQYYEEFFNNCKFTEIYYRKNPPPPKSSFNIEIPDYVSVGHIIGKNGKNIEDVKNKFNIKIIVDSKSTPNVIKIFNSDNNLDEIKKHYEEIFRKRYKIIDRNIKKLMEKTLKNVEKIHKDVGKTHKSECAIEVDSDDDDKISDK